MIVKIPFVQSAPIGHCLHVSLISKEYDPAEQLEQAKLLMVKEKNLIKNVILQILIRTKDLSCLAIF